MSFEIAMSGINAVSASLETISNNIANASTSGFKSSRTNFSAVYAGTQANGAAATSQTQSIGKGGGLMNTGSGMDALIQGRGFFAVKDNAGQQLYTRVGSFSVDKDGYVVDTLGRKLQGYGMQVDSAGRPVAGLGALGDLKVPNGQIAAQASSQLKFTGNLSADWTVPSAAFDPDVPNSYNSSITSVVYDSLGGKHSVTQYFVKSGGSQVDVHYSFDGAAPTAGPTLTFDTQGQLTSATTATLNVPAASMNGADPLAVAIDYTGTTQFAGDTTTLANSPNGYPSGALTGTSLSADGSVVATYSNGQTQIVGTVALATFADEGALRPVDGTSWAATTATGAALMAQPGSAASSKLTTGALEQSNVDMTGELVNLMGAQRSYQANTKVLSAENEMMQSLMQAI
ncbi:flagellar hook protein FlgE [Pelomonas sp. KK5]|uniref:flagellar hook protein FlgE n=1 Tax=Pelomonas sp. KK5 TaxID=1855730 RepID=UPI00097C4BE5|nr:flagellar hook-basal body complex protein [Pelomonas sp. KK5]